MHASINWKHTLVSQLLFHPLVPVHILWVAYWLLTQKAEKWHSLVNIQSLVTDDARLFYFQSVRIMQMNAYRRTIFQTSAQSHNKYNAPVSYFKLASACNNYVMHCLNSHFIGVCRVRRKYCTCLLVICINKHWQCRVGARKVGVRQIFAFYQQPIAYLQKMTRLVQLILAPLNLIEEQV